MTRMGTSKRSVAKDFDFFVKKTKIAADVVLRKLALDGYGLVLLKSPVDTGRFRGSWRLSVEVVDLSILPKTGNPQLSAGAPPSSEELSRSNAVASATFGQTIFISNNLPYAVRLENGYSTQAPGTGAILKRSLDELVADFRVVVAAVRKEL